MEIQTVKMFVRCPLGPLTGQRSLLRVVDSSMQKDSDTGYLGKREWAEETAVFFQGILDESLDSDTPTALREKIEGWMTGLRQAVLPLRHRSDRDRMLPNLPEESRYQTDYLIFGPCGPALNKSGLILSSATLLFVGWVEPISGYVGFRFTQPNLHFVTSTVQCETQQWWF